jgi:hypothetical protein
MKGHNTMAIYNTVPNSTLAADPIPAFTIAASMDQINIKTPNPKCRLYWCLIEFIDWRYIGIFQWWANLDQAPEDLDKNIFRDLSPTPKP